MRDEDRTLSRSLVLDLRILWRHLHTLFVYDVFHVPRGVEW